MTVHTFEDPGDVDEASGVLHDRWFDVTAIREEGRDLVIPFASKIVGRASKAVMDSDSCSYATIPAA
ncbi:MAG TPA: hypothetical protein VMB53_15665 [Gaiellaceae bacterium]|nr:hypothetical protein [Gaiellaceae bacterium]